jgi:hypothetical protein
MYHEKRENFATKKLKHYAWCEDARFHLTEGSSRKRKLLTPNLQNVRLYSNGGADDLVASMTRYI